MCATSLKCHPRCLPRPKSGGWRAWVAVGVAACPHSCSADTACGSRTGTRIPHPTPSQRFSANSIQFNKLLFSVSDPDPHVFGRTIRLVFRIRIHWFRIQHLKTLNFLTFSYFCGSFFCPPGSGSTDLIISGTNPDPKHWVRYPVFYCFVIII